MTRIIPRKSDRRRFLVEINLRCVNGGNAFEAHAIDFGASGISVFTKRFIQPGDAVELEFKTARSPITGNCPRFFGNVAHARVESDGNILGIEFSRPLSPQQMHALGVTQGKSLE